MKFKSVKNLKECKILWNLFSPKKSLWDLWDFNECFLRTQVHSPNFIVGFENEKPVGVLPLWYDSSDDTYCFFGGYFPEKRIFYLNKSQIHQYLKAVSEDDFVTFWDVAQSEKDCLPFQKGETHFSLNLKKYDFKLDNYFKTFNKKHRKNLRYDMKKIELLKPQIKINDLKDYPKLVQLNKNRFGEESDFHDPEQEEGILKLINLAKNKNMLNLVSILIDGKVEASEIAVIYNDVYYVLGGGANLKIKNLGKYLNLAHIKQAIEKKIPIVDFMTSDSGWKRLWKLDEEQLYNYVNYDEEEEGYEIIPLKDKSF